MGIDNPSTLKSFIRYFKDHPPTFEAKLDKTAMRVDGKKYAYDDLNSVDKLFDATTALRYDLAEWWRAEPQEKITWFVEFIEGTYRKEALDLRRNRDELKEALRGNGKSELALPNTQYILLHLQPFRILGEQRRESGFQFWDTKTGRLTPYDYYSVHTALRAANVDKEMIDQFLTQILHAHDCYDPHGNYGINRIPGPENIYSVNQYVIPEWRGLQVEPELPDEIEKLMAHLFPKEECREFVYTWIYHSLTSRAGTYLYLCGGHGSGKNTLAQVIAALHGAPNSSNPKQDAIYGRFNQYLKNKRFVFFDEFNCRTRQDKDTLKRIINNRIQIEAKNKDHEDILVHASYFLANNSTESIGIDPIDRRFSIPDTTWDSINPVLGLDFIPNLLAKLQDLDFVARLGRWILKEFKEPKFGAETPYQRARFEEIVLATARQGIAEILVKLFNREQDDFSYYEEKESFQRVHKGAHYPNLVDWVKFFREVRKDGKPLGKLDGFKLYVADEWKVKRC